MKYETIKFNVGDEEFDVIHCLGDGQCECGSCKKNGKWSLSWTPWFYKLHETDENVLCRNCLAEILIQNRIDKAIKDKIEQGTLIELPCKVGDTVYQTDGVRIYESKVELLIYDCGRWAFNEKAIGTSVFLTREEAEEKLKELQKNEND